MGVDHAEAAEAEEEGVDAEAEEGLGWWWKRCEKAGCSAWWVRDEEKEARPEGVSSKSGASESKRSGEASKSGESRATSSRKAASFLSHMPSSTLSTGTEGLSRDWMLLKR